MSKGVFITGTSTEIGKTFVTALIVKKLFENGLNPGYYKAVLSGAEVVDGELKAGDAEYVCKIAGIQTEKNSLVSYVYENAVSPHLAAQMENRHIEMNKLLSDFNSIRTEFDFLTVEGSGGIVCPLRIDEQIIMLTDIIKAFDLDIIIVAEAVLGTINSTVLTIEHAMMKKINVRGIILNKYESDNFMHVDNKKQIEFLTGVPVIACIPENAADLTIDMQEFTNLYREV